MSHNAPTSAHDKGSNRECEMPRCGEPLDRWPGACGRVRGHDGDWHGPRNPVLIGDPWYGNLVCRTCGGNIHADEPHRKVVRFWWLPGRGGWARSFAHDLGAFQ
jgi:hypothetical protein